MKTYRKLTLPVLLTAAALTLGACAQQQGGGGDSGGNGGGMQGMDHGNDEGGAPGGTTEMSMGEATGGATEGTSRMSQMQGMEGMDQGQTGPGSMAQASRELVMSNGEYSDEAFIDAMVPHHRGAVDMAEVALKNAGHREIRDLAEEIVGAQEAEIKDLRSIKRREFGTSKIPPATSEEDMAAMGMTDPGRLAGQRPFDRAFIDAMTPHHESAIAMAEVASKESDNAEIREIARGIVDAQKREKAQMERWREEWYPRG
ncbi:MAG: DUF305 domain-containing protein [Rubrobacter sp.]